VLPKIIKKRRINSVFDESFYGTTIETIYNAMYEMSQLGTENLVDSTLEDEKGQRITDLSRLLFKTKLRQKEVQYAVS
jgi:hypothetical protein